jgi:hypothetical protein
MKPTIGRIVHYHPYPGTQPEAAIVVAVHGDTCVNLSVCNAGGTWSTKTSVSEYAEGSAGEHWAWPERK